ncbi:MAG: PQQ-dependent sugar dehydrogenase [Verrucomicrobiae bacterium]|nr:PQQ-dependent sugar dehydrogenase [Verrucomicrobiae bacterium]
MSRRFGLFWNTAVTVLALEVSAAAGPLQRVANTTLQLPPATPTFGFTATNAFPTLVFTNPVCIASPPGETNRLFIVEKRGRIIVITNLAAPTRTVFLDITDRVSTSDTVSSEEGLLGLAFHPGYATNRFFYVFYTGNDNTGSGLTRHDILSRFTTSETNANLALPASELKLLRQRDDASNHNGGDLHFGPDGYLYVSLGDEGGQNDAFNNSQIITNDFFSAILRIDVDKRPGSLPPNPHPAATTNYAVPPDNPFVGATNFNGLPVNPATVRTEFWAVGFRNPWRMAFDPETWTLYCGDVGQSLREEVDIVERGRNYGWAYWEGNVPGPKSNQVPAGFVHTPPLRDYPRSDGLSVIGGRVYRGLRFSQLYGAYVYGDYGSGRIWALRHSGSNVTEHTLLLVDDLNSMGVSGLAAFGRDPSNDDLLYADEQNGTNGRIKRIIYNTAPSGPSLPPTLADTGAFTNLATLAPAPGIVPYDLNLPFWSDYALKWRWFSVPDTNRVITFNRDANWLFPTGTVWIKHFELELTNGVPASRRRLETRFLVRTTNGVYGITYRWGNSTTNATLVPEEGMNETFVVNEGGGILRTQVWRYPGRVECLQCHTAAGGYALGFNTPQLNRDFDYEGVITNQLAALSLAGYFHTNVTGLHTLRALASPTNDSVSLEYRVRSWLAANCANCHQPGGPAHAALWDARITTPTADAGLINGALAYDPDPARRVIVPGSLSNSVLLTRIATRGPGQMPPVGSTVPDPQAVALLSAWITNDLPAWESFAAWQIRFFGSTNAPNAAPGADPDNDRAPNTLEYLAGTSPLNSAEAWQITATRTSNTVQVRVPQPANRAIQVEVSTNLFAPNAWTPLDVPANAPFFPASNRVTVVPDVLDPGTSKFYRARLFAP